ncbi:hypothetical protein HYH02_001126 [Chlamydomonas schloesseri]|uniref:Exocyst complex component Sec3 C-terminal domain-containing protein n=1 Tax=Chlamydomonas schloesseri TaxID=2026947 RepID=A0A836BC51_9CHLO|nr:hypothetical protein HYH02_001126 [Chlamydomonas schloesseri]|eukprot:KAG2454086.1 hypothetical protein HYH02_001126 [Chlamydomonas schloesseri]
MAATKLVDAGLQREAEALFANTDEIRIAAFHVLKVKQQGESTGTQLLKALGGKTFLAKEAPQPRLLCLTVRRSKTTRGFKPTLHICHPPDASRAAAGAPHHAHHAATASAAAAAAATKSYPLKTLTEILVPASKYEHNPAHLLELHFSGTGAYSNARGEVVNQLKLRSGEELMLVLALLLALLRQNNYRLPALSGADAGEVQSWWLGQAAAVLPVLGPFAAEVLMPGGEGEGAAGAGAGGAGGGGSRVLLSAKEERDLEELLDMFAMGVGDVAEFEARLAAEHEALEAANVHTIMSTKPAADAVVFAIKKTQGMLEDLDETLLVFDTKLRHMREDIAAIEASNNRLELSARNNTKLLHSLQELLSDLSLPADTTALLEAPPFASIASAAASSSRSDRGPDGRLAAVCRAAWSLAAKLRRLDPGRGGQGASLSLYLLQMRVAQEAREQLTSLAGRFSSAALAHLRALYAAGVEEVLAALAASTDKAAKLVPPPHDRLRAALWRHAELVRCVAALEPGGAMARLAVSYCQPLNMLLRKELRISVAELRKAASLDMQANPIDYGLTSSSNRLGGGAAGAGGAGTGSVVGSGRGPAGSLVGTSVVGSSEGDAAAEHDDVRSLAPSDHLGLGAFAGGPLSSASRQSRSTFRSIMSRTGGGGTYDPFNMAIPLHEAWQGLLEGYLPHLLAEAENAAAVLLLHRGDMKDLIPADALAPPPPDPDEDYDDGGGGGRRRRGKSGRSSRSRSRARAEEAAAAAALTAAAAGGGGGDGGGGGGGPERPLSRTGRQVVDALLSGCDADFLVLVDLTAKSHQVLCLPMMALASACIAALTPRGPVAAPLQLLLAHCHARLGANLAKWVEAQRAAVEAYGARLAGAGSVKSHHVVNFISQFALMAHHIEVMLSQTPDALIEQLSGGAAVADPSWPVAAGSGRAGRSGRGGGSGINGAGRAAGGSTADKAVERKQPGEAAGGGDEDDEEEEDNDEEDEEARKRRELIQQAASWQARPEVDAVYGGLVALMFGVLERLAASDPKHGDRLRAENYGYFVEAVRPLVRHVPALEPYMVQAEAKMEESLSRYVQSQLAYTNLWKLLEASQRMDQLLQVVSPAEVPYQAGFSQADVRSLLGSSLKDVDKKVQKMYGRVKKHLGNSNLAYRVWERLYEQLIERYARLDEQLAACYPDLELAPGLEELQDVFRSVGPQSATSP